MTERRVTIAVTRLEHGQDLDLPAYATPGSAGMDLARGGGRPDHLEPGRACWSRQD